jgi:hypothetical protein
MTQCRRQIELVTALGGATAAQGLIAVVLTGHFVKNNLRGQEWGIPHQPEASARNGIEDLADASG